MARRPREKKKATKRHSHSPSPSAFKVGARPTVYIALALLVLVLYVRVYSFGFVYDDDEYVTANRYIQSPWSFQNIEWAFITGYFSNWHPVTWLSHMVDYHLFGLDAGKHHLVNVFLHWMNAVLLFEVLRRSANRWRSNAPLQVLLCSAGVAALFAIHPLHVESVAWISERKDMLSAFFGLGAMLVYTGYVEARSLGRYLLVMLLFALAVMSKSMLVTLPAVLLLLDYWPLERWKASDTGIGGLSPARLVAEKLPLFGISIAAGIVAMHLRTPETVPLDSRIANAVLAAAGYLGSMCWPAGLCFYYAYHPPNLYSWNVAGALAVLTGLSFLALTQWRRRPYFLMGWLWYLITLAPTSGIVQVGYHAMADRYTYLPLVGPFIALSWGAADLVATRKRGLLVLMPAVVLVGVGLGVTAWFQVGYWHDSETLFTHAIAVGQESTVAFNNLGKLAMDQGRYDKARSYLTKALDLNPEYVNALNNLGVLALHQKRYEEAKPYLTKALDLNPENVNALTNLGVLAMDQGRYDKARSYLTKALDLDPEYVDALNNLGALARDQGRYDEAKAYLTKALDLAPKYVDALNNLGILALDQGRYDEAKAYLTKALDLEPGFVPALNNLGLLALKHGRYEEAKTYLTKALDLNPEDVRAINNLGLLALTQRRYDEAKVYLTKALDLDPKNANAMRDLAWLYATCPEAALRNGKKALEYASKAVLNLETQEPDAACYSLDTLAAAYALNNRFDQAVQTEQKALDAATASTNLPQRIREELIEQFGRRMELYKSKMPYIDVPGGDNMGISK